MKAVVRLFHYLSERLKSAINKECMIMAKRRKAAKKSVRKAAKRKVRKTKAKKTTVRRKKKKAAV
ncbi:MAG TPA: hypothetical protein DCY54_04370 [Parachlamydiales bacterium]|nr:hypothetical protein [Parachlamydiales bacterium]HCJ83112.1 hypothetical protein [Parachlamydiales bacterium]HCJ84499.1 hypothetical protein [Parachlamydiales bacterium]